MEVLTLNPMAFLQINPITKAVSSSQIMKNLTIIK